MLLFIVMLVIGCESGSVQTGEQTVGQESEQNNTCEYKFVQYKYPKCDEKVYCEAKLNYYWNVCGKKNKSYTYLSSSWCDTHNSGFINNVDYDTCKKATDYLATLYCSDNSEQCTLEKF